MMKGTSLEHPILQYTTTPAAKDQSNTLQIHPRRYFYPSLSKTPYLKGDSHTWLKKISQQVQCLPLYLGLQEGEVKDISNVIMDTSG